MITHLRSVFIEVLIHILYKQQSFNFNRHQQFKTKQKLFFLNLFFKATYKNKS